MVKAKTVCPLLPEVNDKQWLCQGHLTPTKLTLLNILFGTGAETFAQNDI